MMNKTQRNLLSLLVMVATLVGCGTVQQKTTTSLDNLHEKERPAITSRMEGDLHLERVAGKRVFASFRNSEKLTKALHTIIQQHGGQIVPSADDADWVFQVAGLYTLRRVEKKDIMDDVGRIFENDGAITRGGEITPDLTYMEGGGALSTAQATGLATGLDLAADATGFRAWFNNATVGDPDGYCISGCDREQRVLIKLSLSQRGGESSGATIVVDTKHKQLIPVPLTNEGLNKLAAAPSHENHN